jgi:TPR repeat protein
MPFVLLVTGAVVAVAGLVMDSRAALCVGAVAAVLALLWLRYRFARRYVTPRPPGAAGFDALRAQSVLAKRRGDLGEAERLLMQAVEAGDPEAMFDMGRLVEERDGVEASERWFRMAAEHGHKVARTAFEPGALFNRDGTTPLDR